MKKALIFLLVSVGFCNCNKRKETLDFVALNKAEFNTKPFEFFKGTIADSLRRSHDSCILNRQSLQTVSTLDDLGVTLNQLTPNFNIISKPCYEKRDLHFPLKSLLGIEKMIKKLFCYSFPCRHVISFFMGYCSYKKSRSGFWK